jgi:hypothetical protein
MREGRGALFVRGLRARVAAGEHMTLLCSSARLDETRCHRSLLRALIVAEDLAPSSHA